MIKSCSLLLVALIASGCQNKTVQDEVRPDTKTTAPGLQSNQPASFIVGSWGSGPGEFGRTRPEEGAPEGPMSLHADSSGTLHVLDQVNGRIQSFSSTGTLQGEVPLGSNTIQDLLFVDDANAVVMDRLADRSLRFVDKTGHIKARVGLVGNGVAEGGAITALVRSQDRILVELDGMMTVTIARTDGMPEPDRRAYEGHLSNKDGSVWRAVLRDFKNGTLEVSKVEPNGFYSNRHPVTFPLPIRHLSAFEIDDRGRIYVGVNLARERSQSPFDVIEERETMVVLSENGQELARADFETTKLPEEQFRTFTVSPKGVVYHAQLTDTGVIVRRWQP